MSGEYDLCEEHDESKVFHDPRKGCPVCHLLEAMQDARNAAGDHNVTLEVFADEHDGADIEGSPLDLKPVRDAGTALDKVEEYLYDAIRAVE